MRLIQWIDQATSDMPHSVRARITAETVAHIHDAGLSEDDDVHPLLGDPAKVNAELREMYLTQPEYLELIERPRFDSLRRLSRWARNVMWGLLFFVNFHASNSVPVAWVPFLLLLSCVALYLLTAQLHPVRREQWRSLAFFLALMTTSVVGTQVLWPVILFLTLILPLDFQQAWRRDNRLKRTLALESRSPTLVSHYTARREP